MMKATKPPRDTVGSLNYRDADDTPTDTVPELKALSAAALTLLARGGTQADGGTNPGDRTWSVTVEGGGDFPLDISCSGPDLPDGIPDETAHPSVIPFERPWVGVYRLTVKAPLVALDLYWRPDAPMRIMGFSRGDWEDELLALAGHGENV